jgi:hypothetical protein
VPIKQVFKDAGWKSFPKKYLSKGWSGIFKTWNDQRYGGGAGVEVWLEGPNKERFTFVFDGKGRKLEALAAASAAAHNVEDRRRVVEAV